MTAEKPNKSDKSKSQQDRLKPKGSPELGEDDLRAISGGLRASDGTVKPPPPVCITQLG